MYANISKNLHILSIIRADTCLNVNLLSFTNMDITRFAPELFNYGKVCDVDVQVVPSTLQITFEFRLGHTFVFLCRTSELKLC